MIIKLAVFIMSKLLKRLLNKTDKIRLVLFFATTLIFWGVLIYFSQIWADDLTFEKVIITQNKYIPTEELDSLIAPSIVGKSKESVDLDNVEAMMASHPFIFRAVAKPSGRNKLEIIIEERQPIALFINKDANIGLIDKFGAIMPLKYATQFGDMPVISGVYRNNVLDSGAIQGAAAILFRSKELLEGFAYNLISELKFDYATNSYIIYTSDSALKINFGQLDRIDSKIWKLSVYWQRWMVRNNPYQIKSLDLRWENQVVMTPA